MNLRDVQLVFLLDLFLLLFFLFSSRLVYVFLQPSVFRKPAKLGFKSYASSKGKGLNRRSAPKDLGISIKHFFGQKKKIT